MTSSAVTTTEKSAQPAVRDKGQPPRLGKIEDAANLAMAASRAVQNKGALQTHDQLGIAVKVGAAIVADVAANLVRVASATDMIAGLEICRINLKKIDQEDAAAVKLAEKEIQDAESALMQFYKTPEQSDKTTQMEYLAIKNGFKTGTNVLQNTAKMNVFLENKPHGVNRGQNARLAFSGYEEASYEEDPRVSSYRRGEETHPSRRGASPPPTSRREESPFSTGRRDRPSRWK